MKISIYNNNKNWFYRVKLSDEGVDLEKFIKRFNFSSEEFAFLNPNIKSLNCGCVLIMPKSEQYSHVAAPLETYETVAKMFNCSIEQLKQKNSTSVLFIGQKIFI